MEKIVLNDSNYKDYLIERINSNGEKIIEIKDGVEIIDNVLNYFEDAVEIIIPDSVISAKNCRMPTSLRNIKLSKNMVDLPRFEGCKDLERVTIPEGIKKIEKFTFVSSGVREVILPEGIEIIDDYAFKNCNKLSKINFPESLKSARNAFSGCSYNIINSIPAKCKCNENGAFFQIYEEDLQGNTLVIPNGTKEIGSLANGSIKNNFGEMDFANVDRNKVEVIKIPDGVLKIDEEAIKNFPNLREVILPDSVLEIGNGNFANCNKLEKVRLSRALKTLPVSVYNNLNQTQMDALIIPDSVENLSGDTESIDVNKKGLTFTYSSNCNIPCELVISEGKTHSSIIVTDDEVLKRYSYSGLECKTQNEEINENRKGIFKQKTFCMNDLKMADKISEYTVDGSYKVIGACSFAQCSNLESVVIEPGVEVIGPGAFLGCEKLKKITIPETVKKISPYAFFGCSNLEKVEIKETSVDIDDFAFGKCRNLKEVTLPEKIKRIGKFSFYRCENLERLSGNRSNKIIDDFAFYGCKKMPVYIPEDVENIGNYAFANSGNSSDKTEENDMISADIKDFREKSHSFISIPESIKNIGEFAFASCKSFSDLWFSEKVRLPEIKQGTFENCTGLNHTIVFPKKMKKIGKNAFKNCCFLQTVAFPAGVDNIEEGSFENCSNLENAIFGNEKTRHEIEKSSSFRNCNKLDKKYISDFDSCYYIDNNGRIIGGTKPKEESQKYSFFGIKRGLFKRKAAKESGSKSINKENEKRQKMKNAIQDRLENASFEQLEAICKMLEIDLTKDDDAR